MTNNRNAEKIEKIINKHYQNTQEQIYVKDIIAYQPIIDNQLPLGEFNETGKRANEKESALIKRMMDYIKRISVEALKMHLLDNYNNPSFFTSQNQLKVRAIANLQARGITSTEDEIIENEMQSILKQTGTSEIKPGKENCITRLSLHEFALYPSKERGPLTLAGFKSLISEIEQMSADYPDNLHLFLGTLPVLTEKDIVQNIALYIECGSINHHIHPITKATLSHVDPVYPNTKYVPFTSSYPSIYEWVAIDKFAPTLIDSMVEGHLQTVKKNIKQMKELCKANGHFYDKLHTKLLEIEQNIKKQAHKKNPRYFETEAYQVDVLFLEATTANVKYRDAFVENIAPALSNHENLGMVQYGGNIISKTAGGARFRIATEICADHLQKIALTIVGKDIQTSLKDNQTQPLLATHIINSNTIEATPESLTATTFVQTDPHLSRSHMSVISGRGIGYSSATKTIKAAFGPETTLDFYPQQEAGFHHPDLQSKIYNNNKIAIKNAANKLADNNNISPKDLRFKQETVLLKKLNNIKPTTASQPLGNTQQSFSFANQGNPVLFSKTHNTLALNTTVNTNSSESDTHTQTNAIKPSANVTMGFTLPVELAFVAASKFMNTLWSYLPSTRVRDVDSQDFTFIKEQIESLAVAKQKMAQKSQSVVYKMGVNQQNYIEVDHLYAKAFTEIQNILVNSKISQSQIDHLPKQITELHDRINQLTTHQFKQIAKRKRIVENRNHHRKMGRS